MVEVLTVREFAEKLARQILTENKIHDCGYEHEQYWYGLKDISNLYDDSDYIIYGNFFGGSECHCANLCTIPCDADMKTAVFLLLDVIKTAPKLHGDKKMWDNTKVMVEWDE